MKSRRSEQSGFTLIELILVMLIIAIMSAMLAPALAKFSAGRAVDSAARRVVALARYARTQSINDGRVYRLNFDESNKQLWLTVGDSNVFTTLPNDYGPHFQLPPKLSMKVDITVQPNLQLLQPDSVQQDTVPQNATLLNGTQSGTTGSLMRNLHADGEYIEFDPTGRTDPATISLSDTQGNHVEISCPSPSDIFSIISAQEPTR